MKLIYQGTKLTGPQLIKRSGQAIEKIYPYIANAELIKTVNLAILLQRPLLLMGEPGCGKSRLAQAVAYELYHQENGQGEIVQDYQDYYQEWHIKSSSKATEGLYEYDAIQRLGDAQIHKKDLNKEKYIQLRAMGQAFEKSIAEYKRVVLLIDEIDKADIDFPNDLLNELDRGQFTISETDKTIHAPAKPIVFITSNGEKELPDAFLRRCLFHYIEPLDKELLQKIIEARFYATIALKQDLVTRAVEQFLDIRAAIKQEALTAGKNVSTSELLDWFEALQYYQKLKDNGEVDNPSIANLVAELTKLGRGTAQIPFQQILFKNWNTILNFKAK